MRMTIHLVGWTQLTLQHISWSHLEFDSLSFQTPSAQSPTKWGWMFCSHFFRHTCFLERLHFFHVCVVHQFRLLVDFDRTHAHGELGLQMSPPNGTWILTPTSFRHQQGLQTPMHLVTYLKWKWKYCQLCSERPSTCYVFRGDWGVILMTIAWHPKSHMKSSMQHIMLQAPWR